MLSESFNLAIVPLSLGITGLIFLGIAYYQKYKYSYRGGIKTTGTLVGFRKLNNDHYFGAMQYAFGVGTYQDYDYNVTNSKPILQFSAGGNMVEYHSEWSVGDLGKKDIGKSFPVRYFPSDKGLPFRVILDGKQYEQQRIRGRRIIFGIFAGIGWSIIGITLLLVLLYQMTT
jgi:hypothetical protein